MLIITSKTQQIAHYCTYFRIPNLYRSGSEWESATIVAMLVFKPRHRAVC